MIMWALATAARPRTARVLNDVYIVVEILVPDENRSVMLVVESW